MLKGIGIGAIIKLVLAIMVASLFISMSSIGSLGQALQQSFTDINQYTDQTTEIEDAKTLNDLTLFVRDRALNDGCTVVNNVNDGQKPFNAVRTDGDFEADGWGYPGLKGTQPLTQHPTCFGGEAGAVRDPGGLIPGSGLRDFTNFVGDTPDENFMPGIYSRQKFKVPEDLEKDAITIGGRENNGRYWLDENLVNVVPTTPEKASEAIRAAEGGTSLNDLRPGLKEAVAAGTVCRVCAAGMLGIDVGINVVDEIGNTWFDDENRKGTQIERPVIYFKDQNVDIDARTNLEAIGDEYDTDSNIDISELNLRVNLCPGDEGYVQGSRGYPDGHGHSSDEPLYPIIVVEKVEQPACGDLDIEEDALEGDVTTEPSKEATGDNSNVINKTGSSIEFEPNRSPHFSDYIVWEPLPEGEKTIEITLNFIDRGHLQIDAQRDAGEGKSDTISGLNTDRFGNEHLWRFNSNDDFDTEYDYPLNSDFTVVLERSEGETGWSVREGGEEKWSFSKESQDFRRLVFESWISENAPELEIKKVEITDKE
ncbi:MAG: hypothetical protein ACLFTA_02100 [Candidatus Nanohaloarchaea archaeon]